MRSLMAQARNRPKVNITLPPDLEQAMRRLADRDYDGNFSRAIAETIRQNPVTKSILAANAKALSPSLT